MTPAEILRAAKAKIADPGSHCRQSAACDAHGNETDIDSKAAVAWCAYGAKGAVQFGSGYSVAADCMASECLRKAANGLGYCTVVECNDTADHPTVLAMFDRAIALAEGEEK